MDAYSSCGRTIILYATSRSPLDYDLTFLLTNPSDLLAFEVILFM